MTRSSALLAAAALAVSAFAAPAFAQGETRTQLVNDKGQTVDSLLLRYAIEAHWVLDDSHILLRDSRRNHYYVTLAGPCTQLEKYYPIRFVPALTGRIRSGVVYEARTDIGEPCDITKVEQVPAERAAQLRASRYDG